MRILTCALLLSTALSATAAEQASTWLNALSQSLKERNFSTSFVVVKNNRTEPYHWFHGINEKGEELEILSLLNGPRRDVLRKNNIVSYIEPELPPYSVTTGQLNGPIPSIFSGDILSLTQNYDFILVGKNRILGRPAQIIRIVSKDQHRFGHRLWLDEATGMLVKMALFTRQGAVLEQIQFTHLEFLDTLPEPLLQLQSSEFPLPMIMEAQENIPDNELRWKVNWLPSGFERIQSNRHRISLTKQPVEFRLFSDGLIDISVYINKSNVKNREIDFVRNGATGIFNQVVNGLEMSVIGKIPADTAKAIANSITLLPKN